ncbi:MAG TPA: HPP family protein [Aliiroseovarius sp.]|nr:HPP family protein [Aliiroseovarius sp.]
MRTFIGTLLGIGLVGAMEQFVLNDSGLIYVIGAFGATAVLVYAAPFSPLAHPYNVLIGHIISAAIGVSVFAMIGEANWLSAALAVSLAIFAMQMTGSLHPPGGASALIAIVSSPQIHALGYFYVLYPVAAGALILLAVAWQVNNAGAARRWPERWLW